MPLRMPARPTVSLARPQNPPLMLRPSVAVRSTSANVQASFCPSLQPNRAKAPTFFMISCSTFNPNPISAFDAQAQRGRAVHVGERPSLVLPITPAQPREGPDVLHDLLLDIQPEPNLGL